MKDIAFIFIAGMVINVAEIIGAFEENSKVIVELKGCKVVSLNTDIETFWRYVVEVVK